MHIAIVDLVANPGAGQRFTGTLAREIASVRRDWDVTLVIPEQALRSGMFSQPNHQKQVGLINEQSLQRWFPNHRIQNLPGSWQLSNFLRRRIQQAYFGLEKQILSATKNADLIFFPWPNFVPMAAVFESSLPMVMTLHDLMWKYISVYEPSQEADLDCRVSAWLKRMACVVAITRHLRIDLAKYFPNATRRVEVIHQAATDLSNCYTDGTKRLDVLGIQKPYFLTVAPLWGHKNHSNLLRAISNLYKDRRDHGFVFVGLHTEQAFAAHIEPSSLQAIELRNLVQELGLSPGHDIKGLGLVSDADLSLLYSYAEAVIIPSMMEGCSLPLLEATALSRPVLCSDIAAHREMAELYGITPFFFSPHDPSDIERSLQEFLRQGTNEQVLNSAAKCVRARTWKKVAEQYIEVFEAAL